MSTTTEKPLTEPPKPEHHDEFTGAFGFFRKYQKLILYTAGIFALITFSITGAMTQWVRGLTDGPTGPQPQIQVLGRTVSLEIEDQQVGGRLARHRLALPPTVLPEFVASGESSELASRFAILRRASIECGLDVSMQEVDDSIDWMVKANNSRNKSSDTPTQAALQRGLNSLAEYRQLVKEGMRIGNYAMLMCAGVDTSDAAIMTKLLGGEKAEKLSVRVATFDMKALEAQLKAKGDVTEDDVRKWMDAKTDAEKTRLEVFDSNHVALVLGIARFQDFDPEQWTEELASFNFGDEQLRRLYKQELDRFKDENGKARPVEDADVAAQLKKIAQVDEVLNKLLAKIREAQQEVIKPLVETQQKDLLAKAEKQQLRDEAKRAAEAAPNDQDLQQKLREAEDVFVAMESAAKASSDAIDAARKSFDFRGKFGELTKDKKGFELREVGAPRVDGAGGDLKNSKALKDLAAIDLGEWKLPELATALRNAGEIGGAPARARNGAFLLQVTDVVLRPMKPWDELKEHLEAKYFEEKAKQTGDEKKKVLEDELFARGKALIVDEIATIEQKRQTEIDKQFGDWEKKVTDDLAKANETLAKLTAGTMAHKAWQQSKDQLEAELAGRDKKREQITKEVGEKVDTEIKDAAKKKYGDVIDAAAEVAGFTLTTIPPHRRDLRSQPNWNKRYDRTIVFLWGGIISDLEAGDSTSVVEDTTERRWQVACVKSVEPLAASDITRREFTMMRRNFGLLETMQAMQQSFSFDALKKRYHYVDPEGRQDVGKK